MSSALVAEEHGEPWEAEGVGWRRTKAGFECLVGKDLGGSGLFQLNKCRRFERKQRKQLKERVAKKPLQAPEVCSCEKEPKESQFSGVSPKLA